MLLNDLQINKEAIISDIKVPHHLKQRLYDLGMVKGTKIKKLLSSKSMNAYYLKGFLLALRKEDTKEIGVILCK